MQVEVQELMLSRYDEIVSMIPKSITPLKTGEDKALEFIANRVIAEFKSLNDSQISNIATLAFYKWRGSTNVGTMINVSHSNFQKNVTISSRIILPKGFESIEEVLEIEQEQAA